MAWSKIRMCDYAEAAKAAHAFASGQIRELTHHSKALKAIGPRILRGGAEALKTKCPDAFDAWYATALSDVLAMLPDPGMGRPSKVLS